MSSDDYKKMSLDEIAEAAGKAGDDWAIWKQMADRFERGKSAKIAQIELETIARSRAKFSGIEVARLAQSDPRYVEYLKKWDEYHGAAIKAKVKYDTWLNLFEARRTLETTERERMKLR